MLTQCQGYYDYCLVNTYDRGGVGVRGGGDGNVRSWFIYVRVWVGWQGVGVIVFLCFVQFC